MSPVHRNLNTKPRSTSCDFVSPGDENGERKREHADQGEREGETGYPGVRAFSSRPARCIVEQ